MNLSNDTIKLLIKITGPQAKPGPVEVSNLHIFATDY